jgi:hypothetical protein
MSLNNCLFVCNNQYMFYNSRSYRLPSSYSESINHNQQDGAFRSWTLGGITDKVSDVHPSAKDYSYKHTCESALYPNFRQTKHTLLPNDKISVIYAISKNKTTAIMPKIEILKPDNTVLASYTMQTDSTNVNIWESGILSYTCPSTKRMDIIVRATAQDASALVYEIAEVVLEVCPLGNKIELGTSGVKDGVVVAGTLTQRTRFWGTK